MFGRTKTEPEPAHTTDDDTQAYSTAYDADRDHRHTDAAVADPEQSRKDRFGGINWGADFFGWLVAVAVTVLLAGIIGGVAAGTGADEELLPTASDAELGLAAILTLTGVLLIGYYAGGYVAGRMSRFDGPRQGFGVWLIGLLVTVATVAAGTFLGSEYDVLDRVDLPSIPLSTDTMTTGGVVLAVVLLLGTLLAALAGGSVGRHYHARVDRWT
ncbi:MAG TPA: hypothetical protein VFH10_13610 [Nocardioides sp.]|uniref:hypothetical protein n=1 Tax=Nocardioides sp. TaxID=35761 RepID=UPI002D7EA721|nr:hypothetical protein [Nocardioides sp.]HET6653676.1 hypothetical protein [Nocardioides sp.]